MAFKSSKHVALAAIGMAAPPGAAWWFQKPAPPQPPGSAAARAEAGRSAPPVTVQAQAARQMTLRDEAQAVGSLRSRQSVMLRPQGSGRVTQLNFHDGQRVRHGQLLVQFDDQLPRAQIRQSQAELSIAQANHHRNQELVAQGFISQRSLEESAANLEVAQARLALAQATARQLQIVAPFDGIAGIRSVSVGDYLKDGADIVNLEDLDVVYVDFRLPERLQGKVRTGQRAQVAFDALPGVRYAAVVQAISPQIDADGRAVAVRGCMDNRRLQLRPGMFARVTVGFSERGDALVIPEEAIVPEAASPYVLKIVAGPQAGSRVARRTPVRLGLRAPGWVQVLDGLQVGDLVVTAGQQRIGKDDTPGQGAPQQDAGAAPPASPPPPNPPHTPPRAGDPRRYGRCRRGGPAARPRPLPVAAA